MKKAIELIKELIKEHETSNYCMDFESVLNELEPEKAMFSAYDVGRYETLTNLLNYLERMEG